MDITHIKWMKRDLVRVTASVRNSTISVLLAPYSAGLIHTPYRIFETMHISGGYNNTVLYEDILIYWQINTLNLKWTTNSKQHNTFATNNAILKQILL